MSDNDHTTASALHYHNTTKHSLQRYAKGPEALDWDDQPQAFRWFDGAEKFDLPLYADEIHTRYDQLYSGCDPMPLDLNHLGALLQLSFGLSAWKQYGSARWPLRCNPSSGNLHAEEVYLLCNQIAGLPAGVHHYFSRDHQLEQRCKFNAQLLPEETLLIGLSSIQWREAWKYGERAYRYCQLDTGHAIAALRYAAASLGWQVKLLDQVSDQQLSSLLGLDRHDDFGNAEREHPDVLLQVSAKPHPSVELNKLLQEVHALDWHGKANILSTRHLYQWPILDEVSAVAEKPVTQPAPQPQHNFAQPLPSECELEASLLIRRRRSAQAFDGQTAISAEAFFHILDMTLPRQDTLPWDCTPWTDNINLALFVHRVEGLSAGLYVLVRNPERFDEFKQVLGREQFEWQPVENAPAHLPLYRLVAANAQKLAATLSCHQGIAAMSCFSLGMIADCAPVQTADWHYRRLYWEAGMIGQVLYLEAEAAGIQGTGIGCYFDDSVHEVLGIGDARWQSLYHFTVGKGIQDGRIQTMPAYGHLAR